MAALAAQGQRSGKFRHIYGQPAKPEGQFKELKNPLTSGESRYVSANDKFIAIGRMGGGGPVYVLPIDKPGRVASNIPMVAVHKGKVWDTDFNPFVSNMIATVSDDCGVACTVFPKEGLSETITTPDVFMKGHQKKVGLCQFNPTANCILATASYDRSVKIWNIETQENVATFDQSKDNIFSLEWNYDGSQIAITGKDKKLRLLDPRNPDEAASVPSFDGGKSSKVFWVPNLGWIGATGFSKSARRQLKFWDLKDLSKPIFSTDIDQASSVLMPFYDNDLGVLYMYGKGGGNVMYSEIINDSKKWYSLGTYRDTEPQKGGGWLSKKGCDVWQCEINRFFKLTTKSIIPISFIVPRKSGNDVFQEDIYLDCYAGKAALSATEWIEGNNKEPIKKSMNPENQNDENDDDQDQNAFVKKKSYQDLEKEVISLKERIKELEVQLAAKNGDGDEQKEEQ